VTKKKNKKSGDQNPLKKTGRILKSLMSKNKFKIQKMAAKVYIVDQEHRADYKVFFVDGEFRQKNHQIIAGGELENQEHRADCKLYITDYEHRADIKITRKNFPK
jgi:hypothetical protein